MPTARASEPPAVRLSARPRLLRIRRELTHAASGRGWLFEVEVEVPAIDPERLLGQCEAFLVDGSDGRQIGVVDRVETDSHGFASALLIAAGWFGRRRLRVDAQAIEALVPEERRVIVDSARVHPVGRDDRAA